VKISKVLVALDGSPEADMAFEYALALGKTFSAELILVNVLVIPPAPTMGVGFEGHKIREMIEKGASDIAVAMLDKKLKMAKAQSVETRSQVLRGSPVEQIVLVASKEKADLIVMGNRGLTGLKKILLGSVAWGVTQLATCPVLIVR